MKAQTRTKASLKEIKKNKEPIKKNHWATELKTNAHVLASLPANRRNHLLKIMRQNLTRFGPALKRANSIDLKEYKNSSNFNPALYQRLALSDSKLKSLNQGISDLLSMKDPLSDVQWTRAIKPGLLLEKRNVNLGLIAVIFESRPDVVPQIASLMIKTGNAFILKGGSEARRSVQAFKNWLDQSLMQARKKYPDIPKTLYKFLYQRSEVHDLYSSTGVIDLIIPRGSNAFVQEVISSTQIPVMGHADGVCHMYLDSTLGPITQIVNLVLNAKLQYPSACNALETLLLHRKIAKRFLQSLSLHPESSKLTLLGCNKSRSLWADVLRMRIEKSPRTERQEKASLMDSVLDWHTEYSSSTLAIKIVEDMNEAIEHIEKYGSHHTDGIVTTHSGRAKTFVNKVDSANVYINSSTRLSDGFVYGFGAEVGISTSKFHARGPVGIEGLLSYKYVLRPENKTRFFLR